MTESAAARYRELTTHMKGRVIGQDPIVNAVSQAIRVARRPRR